MISDFSLFLANTTFRLISKKTRNDSRVQLFKHEDPYFALYVDSNVTFICDINDYIKSEKNTSNLAYHTSQSYARYAQEENTLWKIVQQFGINDRINWLEVIQIVTNAHKVEIARRVH